MTLPTGTVTFLFTDLVSSTRLWQDHAEEMQRALARHDEIVGRAITTHGGVVVKKRGDGFHAAFAAAHDAVGAAVAAQLELAADDWPAVDLLQIRMGIHTGPAELRDGDYYGTAVNRAARLESVAHGGQIVVSLATKELVADSGIELIDLGEHTLRDLSRPERVFQVAHPGLEANFPPLMTLDAFSGNLPIQVTSFVGRDDDVARVAGMVERAALVTLIGTGGVGKTRLALQVAAELLPDFQDGAWLCELAAVDDAEAMAQLVAATLGCVQRPGLSLLESIVEYVRVRNLLLVLDNCEHLLDDAGALADAILQRCPDVRVIATSREALDVDGERVIRVRSLDAPATDATAEQLMQCAAVQLFTDRATDAGASASWGQEQWKAVGEVCRRVDGIPLAIELAAARAAAMHPSDIAAHLDERFRLLTGKRRGRVERHQTLRATVEWSYQLLDADERTVFDRLGVFAGSFDAAAAIAVAGGDDLDEWTVIDALTSLVAKSMVLTDDGPEGAIRYFMLETLRQFARERLDDGGNVEAWRRRHAEHYARWARDAGFGCTGPDASQWVAGLRAEADNLRAAVSWALDAGAPADQEIGLRILAPLSEFSNHDNGVGLGALAVRALAVAAESPAELRDGVRAAAGYDLLNRGDVEAARGILRAAADGGGLANAPNPFTAHVNLVYVEILRGNFDAVSEITSWIRAALVDVDRIYVRASTLGGLGSYEGLLGQVAQSRTDAEQALAFARESRNAIALANAYHATAWALWRDEPVAALAAAEQFLAIYERESIMVGSTGSVLALAAGLRSRLGDPAGALVDLHRAVIVSRDQGVRPQLSAALNWGLGPMFKVGAHEDVAIIIGALGEGALAGTSDFPGAESARAATLLRVRASLGDEATDRLLREGAAMTYDDLVAFAVRCFATPETTPDASE